MTPNPRRPEMGAQISAVIDRLQNLECSREVDEAILRALCPEAHIDFYCTGDDEKTVFHCQPLVENRGEIPLYTTSVDAALTLVPEGMNAHLRRGYRGPYASCELKRDPTFGFGPERHYAECTLSTDDLPIAICAAALKARLYLDEDTSLASAGGAK